MNELVNPTITRCVIKKNNCIKFEFVGNLTKDEAIVAVDLWKEKMNESGSDKLILVWYCKEMTGYDSIARSIWQNALKEMKNQIQSIWLISDSLIVKAGAKIMSMFASYEIKVVDSEELVDIRCYEDEFSK